MKFLVAPTPVRQDEASDPGSPSRSVLTFLPKLLCSLALITPAGISMAAHRYSVKVDEAIEALEIQACFDGEAPDSLHANSGEAADYLNQIRVPGADRRFVARGSKLVLGKLPTNACLHYQVVLNGVFQSPLSSENRWSGRVGRDRLISPDLWLWRPSAGSSETKLELTFELPEGVGVSAPWRLLKREAQQVSYLVGDHYPSMSAAVAIGHFPVEDLQLAGSSLRLAVLDGSPRPDPRATRVWLARHAEAAANLYGRYPLDSAQILVIPVASSLPSPDNHDPFPFGMILRGGGTAAVFFIDQRQTLQAFLDSWVPTHELSHMSLPYVRREDAWLSEGLASYYQNILRARAGLLSREQGWQKLHQGFLRGMAKSSGKSLAQTSSSMHRERSYRRVYWSGAAILLLADIELRKQTKQHSLDTVIEHLGRCCSPWHRTWSARELFSLFDSISGTDVFTALYEEHVNSRDFPDVLSAYESLGLEIQGDDVAFADDAPLVQIRRDIMNARPPRSTASVNPLTAPNPALP